MPIIAISPSSISHYNYPAQILNRIGIVKCSAKRLSN